MSRKTEKLTEFVFVGKDYKSKERAEKRIQALEKNGYKLVNSNSKKLTYKK